MNPHQSDAGWFRWPLIATLSIFAMIPALWSGDLKVGVATYTLPDIPLATFLKDRLGIKTDDHQVKLGSVGSDLWHVPGDAPDTFWMITDRGPNGDASVGSHAELTFPVPEFTPFILKVKAKDGVIQIQEALPITGNGMAERGVTGMANSTRDETPYDCTGQTQLRFNPDGLDTEGMVRMRDGSFWLVEEYGPSLVHVDPKGKVLVRFLPSNLNPPTVTSGYPSKPLLPEIFGMRKKNRGFEGIAVSPDEKMLYIVLQSPLLNPSKSVGETSRNTRIFEFDPHEQKVVNEYIYQLQSVSEFGESNPAEMKVSALVMLDEHRLLALERTDKVAKIYRIDLRGATNISGTQWDHPATQPSLESLDEKGLVQRSVKALPKELLAELDSAKGYPPKIEGLAILDNRTIAIANDNDLGIGTFVINGSSCTLKDTGVKSQLVVIHLDQPLR